MLYPLCSISYIASHVFFWHLFSNRFWYTLIFQIHITGLGEQLLERWGWRFVSYIVLTRHILAMWILAFLPSVIWLHPSIICSWIYEFLYLSHNAIICGLYPIISTQLCNTLAQQDFPFLSSPLQAPKICSKGSLNPVEQIWGQNRGEERKGKSPCANGSTFICHPILLYTYFLVTLFLYLSANF